MAAYLEIGGQIETIQIFEWFLWHKLYIVHAQNTQFVIKMIFRGHLQPF